MVARIPAAQRPQLPFQPPPYDAVTQRVLNERLQNESGNGCRAHPIVDRPRHAQSVGKTHLLDRQILLEERELFVKRNLVARIRAKHRVQHLSK